MQVSKLEELDAAGSLIDEGIHKEHVVWTNDAGDLVEFDVFVKNEMSSADFEFIYLGVGDKSLDPSYAARRIHRMVRMAEGEIIPLQKAILWKPSLLRAIGDAINKEESEPPKA